MFRLLWILVYRKKKIIISLQIISTTAVDTNIPNLLLGLQENVC